MKKSTENGLPICMSGTSVGAALLLLCAAASPVALSQEALKNGTVAPMGQWLEYREATYRGKPILVHLRTGYERAIVLPEAVEFRDAGQTLPGCEILINENVVAFYPTQTFTRRPVVFVGTATGIVYDLRVRASTKGMRQPMRLSR